MRGHLEQSKDSPQWAGLVVASRAGQFPVHADTSCAARTIARTGVVAAAVEGAGVTRAVGLHRWIRSVARLPRIAGVQIVRPGLRSPGSIRQLQRASTRAGEAGEVGAQIVGNQKSPS